jgi:hypothetical protein
MLSLLVLVGAVGRAGADQIELTPSVNVLVSDSTGNNSTVLLRFSLPAELTEGEISSADLSLGVLCSEGQIILAWAHPISSDWQNPPSSQWLVSDEAFDEKEATTCEMYECGDGMAHFEVAKFVRGWAKGERQNFGLLLRPAVSEPGVFKVTDPSDPVLRITYKPPQPIEQGN